MYTVEELDVLWELSTTGHETEEMLPEVLKNFLTSLTPMDNVLDNIISTATLNVFLEKFSTSVKNQLVSNYRYDSFYPDRVWFPLRPEHLSEVGFNCGKKFTNGDMLEIFPNETSTNDIIPEVLFLALLGKTSTLTDTLLMHLQHAPTKVLDSATEKYTDGDVLETLVRKTSTPLHHLHEVGHELNKYYQGKPSKVHHLLHNDGNFSDVVKVAQGFTANHYADPKTLMELVEKSDTFLADATVRRNVHTHPKLPSELRLEMWYESVKNFHKGDIFDALNMLIWCMLPYGFLLDFVDSCVHENNFSVPNSSNGFDINVDSLYFWFSQMTSQTTLSGEELKFLYHKMLTYNCGNVDGPFFYITGKLLSNPKTPASVAADFLDSLPNTVKVFKSYENVTASNGWKPVPLAVLTVLAEEKMNNS